MCRHVRAACYSALEKQAYFAAANEAVLVAQLEGKEALAHAGEILAVEGIDVIFAVEWYAMGHMPPVSGWRECTWAGDRLPKADTTRE